MSKMSQLEIQKITLENYRQYYGKQTIELETDGNRNVNIIEGQNGAGKSNILNAVTLCFYGKETHLKDEKESGLETYPYVNRKKLSETDDNEAAHGSIEITLGRNEPEYVFSRGFRTIKLPDGGYSSVLDDKVQLKQKIGQDWKTIDQPSTRLNQILPASVHEYFLFDGERLDDFFDQDYQERVKTGLLDVSHIELIESSIKHLKNVRKDVDAQIDDEGGEAEQKRKEKERAQEEVEKAEEKLTTTKRDIENTQQLIADIDTKLRDSSDPDVRQKQQRRQFLSSQLKEERKNIELIKQNAGESLITAGQVLYAQKPLEYTYEELNELSKKGELPPKIQSKFIEDLIDEGVCICGDPLDEEHEKHLESLQEQMSGVDEDNLEGKFTIPDLLDDAIEDAEELVENRKKLAEAEKKETELNRDLREISEELKSHDLPDDVDVQELERQRNEYEKSVEELTEKKGRLKAEIEQLKKKLDEKEKEYNKAAARREENKEYLQQIQFLKVAQQELEAIKEDILASVRDEIQTKMNEYFNEIIWKDEEYNVTLGDDYEVRVEGPHNDNKIGSLSAGERQVLAFSFLAALTRVSGFDAPILIDTPLGRISSTPKRRIAENLPKYINDTQVTFLMTDEEYTEDVRVHMKPNITNEYRLEFANEVTEVVPYE